MQTLSPTSSALLLWTFKILPLWSCFSKHFNFLHAAILKIMKLTKWITFFLSKFSILLRKNYFTPLSSTTRSISALIIVVFQTKTGRKHSDRHQRDQNTSCSFQATHGTFTSVLLSSGYIRGFDPRRRIGTPSNKCCNDENERKRNEICESCEIRHMERT